MRKAISITVFILVVLTVSSCYYDKKELLYGNTDNANCADAAGTVSYSKQVVPMLQQHCYSCHGGSSALGGVVMGTYANDKALAENGKLYGTISHAPGFSPMPKGAPQINSCQMAVIKKWIESGMANN
jgi:mono/diheme cytochrome c family protein